jgi:hypothetical protein
MNRVHRVVAFVAILVMTLGVTPAPAQAITPLTCQTRTWTLDSSHPDNMSYYAPSGFWQWGPQSVSQCRHGVRWDPSGWRYTPQGNLEVRIRTLNSRGHTWYTTPWVTSIGSGSTVTVAGFVQPGTAFLIETRLLGMLQYQLDQPTNWWPKGQIEY